MKRPFLFLCIFLLLTGCLPTPEVEVIPNKGEQKAWQVEAVPYVPTKEPSGAAQAEEISSSDGSEDTMQIEQQGGPLYEILGASPTWSMENNDYGFLITAQDCPVCLPNVSAVPVVEAARRDFTQADIDAVAAAMFPADTVWYPEVLWTKEEMAAQMQELMDEMANRDPQTDKEWHRDDKYYEDKLAMYKERYNEAPFADEIVPITLQINDCQDDIRLNAPEKKYPGVKAEARVNGEHWTLSARTSVEDPLTTYLEASRGDIWMDHQQPLDAPYGVQMTREEAIEQATAFVQKVAGNEYSVCYCAPLMAHPDFQESSGDTPVATLPERFSQWGLVFMRTFNGCPSAFADEEVGGDMDTTVNKPVHYERMELHIDDQGVSYFRWIVPMTVTGVVNANARLISFDEAAKKAISQIAALRKYDVENRRKNGKDPTIYIKRVTFGLWRIQKKGGGFYYVPVYHFFSEGDAFDWADWVDDNPYSTAQLGISNTTTQRERFLYCIEKEDCHWALMNFCRTFGGDYWGGVTVNALDGTIIDKDKGY